MLLSGGYRNHWSWTGFAGNTLWDRTKLLIVAILMPLVLVPAASRWIAGQQPSVSADS